ncbi:MAG: fibronectin type III domain-containing protein [Gemmatimonadaceae bacterium]
MRPTLRSTLALGALASLLAFTACKDDNGTTQPIVVTKPDAPSNVLVTALSQTSLRVTWSGTSGATYFVERAPGTGTTFTTVANAVTTTSYTDAGLVANTAYQYRVTTVRGSDTSVVSAVASASTSDRLTITVSGNITIDRTFTSDTNYILSGFVKVRTGVTLHIKEGTKIVGDPNVNGSSLWILQGGKIDAVGTATNPIVFTSSRAVGQRMPGDWGGIIIIGKAIANRGCPNALNASCVQTTLTEGPAGGIQNTGENYAGGTDPNDNSGTMRYVRVEYAGYAVDTDQELNAFSMYAVGRGTTLEYLEAMDGLDDSFEWFGGSVDTRYLVSYESGDDHFDWTEGYNGRSQFLIGMQTYAPTPRPGTGSASQDPHLFEGDGCENDKPGCPDYTNKPYSMPVFANFTLLSTGAGVFKAGNLKDANGAEIRRGTGGSLFNGILARVQGIGLDVRDAATDNMRTIDSLFISNNIFISNAGGNFDPVGTNFGQKTNFATNDDLTADPVSLFSSVPAAGGQPSLATLDWSLTAASAARTGGLTTLPAKVLARVAGYFGGTFVATAYRGAADPNGAKWWAGWTNYERQANLVILP